MSVDFTQKQLEPLLELGLNKTQGILYLSLLKHGILSVLELSKITGINRQQVYHETEKLLQLGFLEITRKSNRKYIAVNPNKLLRIGRQKISDAESIFEKISASVPLLESIPLQKNKQVLVKYFEGLHKIKEAYENELDNSKDVEVLSLAGSIDDIYKFFPEAYWDKWNKKFVEQKSKSRMIVHNSEIAREASKSDEKHKRQTKYLESFPLKVNIDIFNNTVLIVSFYDEMAIWIDSPMLASSYRIMFESLWSNTKFF